MRLAIPLLAALAIMTLAACTGDDGENGTPLPVAQRFVTAEETPGSKPDPDETRRTTVDFEEFIMLLRDAAIDPDEDEMNEVFRDGFVSAGVDTRFFGQTHTPGTSTHVVSSFIELASDDDAEGALEWIEADLQKPCPRSCAARSSLFEATDITDGRGVHRVATAEDIERVGTSNEVPFESYWVGFTDGAVVYTVDLFGRPGAVSEQQALEIARAYQDRLTGD